MCFDVQNNQDGELVDLFARSLLLMCRPFTASYYSSIDGTLCLVKMPSFRTSKGWLSKSIRYPFSTLL